jgi:hypothetical protein
MALEPLESQGKLRVMGWDQDGVTRWGEFGMADYHLLPTHALRLRAMREDAQRTAAYLPYFTHVDEIQFWKKRIVDLSRRGLGLAQEAIIISFANYQKQVQGTLVFAIVAKTKETAEFGLANTQDLDQEAIASGIFDEFTEFVQTYKKNDPAKKKSKAN